MPRTWKIALAVLASVVSLMCLPRTASAYPWMIRHEYVNCTTCHADPSGGGLLRAYGRAQGEITLRTPYGRDPEADPGTVGDFLWGAVGVPDSLLLGGSARSLFLRRMPEAGPASNRYILMQADLLGELTVDRFRVNASVGFVHEGAFNASITRGVENRMISRLHWLGLDLGEDKQFLLRAGRMNLPFGVRSVEHTMWVRSETRTDINAAQQHGVALAWNTEKIRAEVMAIAGNFQISPPRYWAPGYAGYFEYAFLPKLAAGVSSMVTRADRDLGTPQPALRGAHGAFARYSPVTWLVLTSEVDFLHASYGAAGALPGRSPTGLASMLTADFMPMQGLHMGPTLEVMNRSVATDQTSFGVWGTVWWFFAPHADVRVDVIHQSMGTPAGSVGLTSLLGQLHVYL